MLVVYPSREMFTYIKLVLKPRKMECLSSIYPEMFTYFKLVLKPRKMDDQSASHLSIQSCLPILN